MSIKIQQHIKQYSQGVDPYINDKCLRIDAFCSCLYKKEKLQTLIKKAQSELDGIKQQYLLDNQTDYKILELTLFTPWQDFRYFFDQLQNKTKFIQVIKKESVFQFFQFFDELCDKQNTEKHIIFTNKFSKENSIKESELEKLTLKSFLSFLDYVNKIKNLFYDISYYDKTIQQEVQGLLGFLKQQLSPQQLQSMIKGQGTYEDVFQKVFQYKIGMALKQHEFPTLSDFIGNVNTILNTLQESESKQQTSVNIHMQFLESLLNDDKLVENIEGLNDIKEDLNVIKQEMKM